MLGLTTLPHYSLAKMETDPGSGRGTEALDERETRGIPDFLLSPL
jgi:hypothetical protein